MLDEPCLEWRSYSMREAGKQPSGTFHQTSPSAKYLPLLAPLGAFAII